MECERIAMGRVALRRLDEGRLRTLLAAAVHGARPEEAMPPVDAPPGWSRPRQAAFLEWHRARRPGLEGPLRESTYAVVEDDRVIGSVRLAGTDDRDELECGIWLARGARGRGVAAAALLALGSLVEASGTARVLVARTTAANRGAVRTLERLGATIQLFPDKTVRARLSLIRETP
ncbi:GNAT family N-acetyltransferase [Streptomyces sp. NPDC006879]|uniref:GNAT family N-acetyltransferase n=1 Tax=Streptomyces sp. NPDC006879 TaxID=3364767 RepID=UPI0036809B62